MTHYTEPLDEFLKKYNKDVTEWWRTGSGDLQNLFDEAIVRLENIETVVKEMEEHTPPESSTWVYIYKLRAALEGRRAGEDN